MCCTNIAKEFPSKAIDAYQRLLLLGSLATPLALRRASVEGAETVFPLGVEEVMGHSGEMCIMRSSICVPSTVYYDYDKLKEDETDGAYSTHG